jgi:hypothetical protein
LPARLDRERRACKKHFKGVPALPGRPFYFLRSESLELPGERLPCAIFDRVLFSVLFEAAAFREKVEWTKQMKRRLISIGYEIPGFSDDCYEYSSDQSLLDADVLVFEPETYDTTYGGKTTLNESGSFDIQQAAEHWRRELSTALEHGKTVFLILRRYQIVQIDTR